MITRNLIFIITLGFTSLSVASTPASLSAKAGAELCTVKATVLAAHNVPTKKIVVHFTLKKQEEQIEDDTKPSEPEFEYWSLDPSVKICSDGPIIEILDLDGMPIKDFYIVNDNPNNITNAHMKRIMELNKSVFETISRGYVTLSHS